MCKSIMKSIKTLQKEWEINHKRLQEARKKEDDRRMRKFLKFEQYLRSALKIYKEMILTEEGVEAFCPQDNFFIDKG